MKEVTEKEAFGKMATLCSTSEYCKSDIREKLRKWRLDDVVVDNILRKLEQENYLNEERYCNSFIHDKLYINKWGTLKIAQALYAKGISGGIIQNCLDEIDRDDYLEILRKLLETKKRTVKAKNDYEFKGKLMRFAYSRGFTTEDVQRYLL